MCMVEELPQLSSIRCQPRYIIRSCESRRTNWRKIQGQQRALDLDQQRVSFYALFRGKDIRCPDKANNEAIP